MATIRRGRVKTRVVPWNELVLEPMAINKGPPCLRFSMFVHANKRACGLLYNKVTSFRRQRVEEVGGNHTLHNEFLYG